MKLALIGPCHPLRGGIAHYNARLYQALEAEGHDVRLFGMSRQYPGFFFPGTTQEDRSQEAIEAPAQLILDSTNPLSWINTWHQVRAFGPQAAIFQWWHPFFAPPYATIAWLLRRTTHTVPIYLCHNVRPHEATLVDDMLLKVAYAPVDRFLVHASKEEDRLTRLLPGRSPRVEVAPHPVYDIFKRDPSLTQAQARATLGLKRPHQLLFFGYVRPYKGLGTLLEAMALLGDTLDCELTVAGECYEDPAIYQNMIARLGLQDRVHLLNRYIPNEEVPTLFEAADLCVLPYKQATQSGIVQVAYALETPVVVTRVGGIPEVVDDGVTGLLAEPDSPQSVAEQIARFFEQDLSDALKEGIAAKQRQLSWGKLVEALQRLI